MTSSSPDLNPLSTIKNSVEPNEYGEKPSQDKIDIYDLGIEDKEEDKIDFLEQERREKESIQQQKLQAELERKAQVEAQQMKQQAIELYRLNHAECRLYIAQALEHTITRYLDNFIGTQTFVSQMDKIFDADRVCREHEFSLYGNDEKYFIDSKKELFRRFLSDFIGTQSFFQGLDNLTSVQRTLTPTLAISTMYKKHIAQNNLQQKLLAKCAQALTHINERHLQGFIGTQTYHAQKNDIEYTQLVIERVRQQTQVFSTVDWEQTVVATGAQEKARLAQLALEAKQQRDAALARRALERAQRFQKISTMFSHILKSSLRFLQEKVFSFSSPKKEEKNEIKDSQKGQTDKKLATQALYVKLHSEIEATQALSHKERLVALLQNIGQIFESDNVYKSLSAEQSFLLDKVYPDVISNIRQQCVLDQENFKLTGQSDLLLPQVIKTFEDKITSIFQEKLEQDQKQTKVLSQYLKAKV